MDEREPCTIVIVSDNSIGLRYSITFFERRRTFPQTKTLYEQLATCFLFSCCVCIHDLEMPVGQEDEGGKMIVHQQT